MPVRTATAAWEGSLQEGHGTISVESGRLEAPYSFGSRFESEAGTGPRGVARRSGRRVFHDGVVAGALRARSPPDPHRHHRPRRHREDGRRLSIPRIELRTEAAVDGIDDETFHREAEKAKVGCPVSQALAATEIQLVARLVA
jgi:osmotically inducible protein OsmC